MKDTRSLELSVLTGFGRIGPGFGFVQTVQKFFFRKLVQVDASRCKWKWSLPAIEDEHEHENEDEEPVTESDHPGTPP